MNKCTWWKSSHIRIQIQNVLTNICIVELPKDSIPKFNFQNECSNLFRYSLQQIVCKFGMDVAKRLTVCKSRCFAKNSFQRASWDTKKVLQSFVALNALCLIHKLMVSSHGWLLHFPFCKCLSQCQKNFNFLWIKEALNYQYSKNVVHHYVDYFVN